MRRLLPEPPARTDPWEAYADVPGVRVGMVMSVDGSATDAEGWTDGLGGEADFRVFRTLRALADVILVGAGTARTGRLGPARLGRGLRDRRGGPPAPIAVVSRSLDLDWTLPLFTAAETPTIVVTSRAAAAASRVPGVVRVVTAGEEDVDLRAGVQALRAEYPRLLCEGGPSLVGSLLKEGLVDELCLSVAPALLGGDHHTRLVSGLPAEVALDPAAVYLDEGVLFLRYAVARR